MRLGVRDEGARVHSLAGGVGLTVKGASLDLTPDWIVLLDARQSLPLSGRVSVSRKKRADGKVQDQTDNQTVKNHLHRSFP
jgi:hypothetical protein